MLAQKGISRVFSEADRKWLLDLPDLRLFPSNATKNAVSGDTNLHPAINIAERQHLPKIWGLASKLRQQESTAALPLDLESQLICLTLLQIYMWLLLEVGMSSLPGGETVFSLISASASSSA